MKDLYDQVLEKIGFGKVTVDFTEESGSSFAAMENGDLLLEVGTKYKPRITHNLVNALLTADSHLTPDSDEAQFYQQFQNGTSVSGIDIMEKTAELNTARLNKVKDIFTACQGEWTHLTLEQKAESIHFLKSETKPTAGHRFLQQLYYGDLNAPLREWNARFREEFCNNYKYQAICSDIFNIEKGENLNMGSWYNLVKGGGVHSDKIQAYLDKAFEKCLPLTSFEDCLNLTFKSRN